ncbi:hypothetical protein [Natrinema sp. 1APR25-10V2]|uniref:hypothetical protein n=1 Tax=Natrinema sp. 1APR25-10V2 TaxID=2951081 RepID=UPI0028764F39|nr:hypothetical protein [Natrinema sp. 1APR25-10V2]MDS0476573.1 hypothetical protein [Natrinema sp. 1APR25-10V2]
MSPPFDGPRVPSAYCGECDWQYRADGDEPDELSRAMIDHFVETGHSPVERRDADERLEKHGDDGTADASSDGPGSEAGASPKRE